MSLNNSIADGYQIQNTFTASNDPNVSGVGSWGITPRQQNLQFIQQVTKQSEDGIPHIYLPSSGAPSSRIIVGSNTVTMNGGWAGSWPPLPDANGNLPASGLPETDWITGDKIELVLKGQTDSFSGIWVYGRVPGDGSTQSWCIESSRNAGESHEFTPVADTSGTRYLRLEKSNHWYTITFEFTNDATNEWTVTVTSTDTNIADWTLVFTDNINWFRQVYFTSSSDSGLKVRQTIINGGGMNYALASTNMAVSTGSSTNVKRGCKTFGPRFRNLIY